MDFTLAIHGMVKNVLAIREGEHNIEKPFSMVPVYC
jgi:hypothetical protein